MARLALLFTGNRAAHLKARYPHNSHQQAFLHPEMPESERINCEEQQLKIIARAITQGIADLHAQMTALCGQISQFCIGGFCGGWEALRSTLECNFGWQIRFSR